MKISHFIEKLEQLQNKHGDIDVVIYSGGDVYSIDIIRYNVAEKNQFPKEYNMPRGFEFVSIG